MLSAELLITDIEETIQDPSVSRESILRYLNAANLAIADKLLLPDLSSGSDTVATDISSNRVKLPGDFHKNITLAQIDGDPIRVYPSLSIMVKDIGFLRNEDGPVVCLAVQSNELFYSEVPTVSVSIDLNYYRLPVSMSDAAASFPDGVRNSQDFEDCLLEYSCWRLFRKIEDGLEPGQMVNTNTHRAFYVESLEKLNHYCSKYSGLREDIPLSSYPDLFI